MGREFREYVRPLGNEEFSRPHDAFSFETLDINFYAADLWLSVLTPKRVESLYINEHPSLSRDC